MKLHLSHGDSATANISRRKGSYPGLAMQPCSLLSGRLDPYQKSGSFDRYATDKGSKLLSDTGGVLHATPWGWRSLATRRPRASHVCRPQIVPSRKIALSQDGVPPENMDKCHSAPTDRDQLASVSIR